MPDIASLLGNPLLETIISLALIYFLLSTIVSMVVEVITHKLRIRSFFLMDSIERLLDDPANMSYGYLVYNHPLVDSLKLSKGVPAKYLASDTFALAFMDVISSQANPPIIKESSLGSGWITVQEQRDSDAARWFWKGVQNMKPSAFKDLLTSFVHNNCEFGINANETDNATRLRKAIETWYNNFQDRMTGQYKIYTNKYTWIASATVVLFLNIDSLHLLKVLKEQPTLRRQLADLGERVLADSSMIPNKAAGKKQATQVVFQLPADTGVAQRDTNKAKEVQNSYVKMMLRVTDSLTVREEKILSRTDTVLELLEAYQVPLGWNGNEVPLIWRRHQWWWNSDPKKIDCSSETNPEDCKKCEEEKASALASIETDRYLVDLSVDHRKEWGFGNFFGWVFGLFLTTLALTFGSPFWFDVLNKFVNIRKTGIKPKTQTEPNT